MLRPYCNDCGIREGQIHRLGCITRVNEGMSGMEITGAKVTTEVKYPASYQDDRKEYIIKLDFVIPGGSVKFEIPSTEARNKAIEAVMTLRGGKVRTSREIGLDLIRRHALLKDPTAKNYGQDDELFQLLNELTVALVKEY